MLCSIKLQFCAFLLFCSFIVYNKNITRAILICWARVKKFILANSLSANRERRHAAYMEVGTVILLGAGEKVYISK